jgi:hypothetical protein
MEGESVRRNATTCDMCDAEADSPDGWMTLVGADIRPLDFCSLHCVADYTRLQALNVPLPLE